MCTERDDCPRAVPSPAAPQVLWQRAISSSVPRAPRRLPPRRERSVLEASSTVTPLPGDVAVKSTPHLRPGLTGTSLA